MNIFKPKPRRPTPELGSPLLFKGSCNTEATEASSIQSLRGNSLTNSIEEGNNHQDTTLSKVHLQTITTPNLRIRSPMTISIGNQKTTSVGILPPGTSLKKKTNESSDDVLVTARSKPTNRARKNVGAFRRRRQDYATWKGRVGVHVETDEIDLKKLVKAINQTLSTDWELVDHYDDHYDVIRLWLPVDNAQFSGDEQNVPSGGGEYDAGNGEIDASMPEVFVFGFGAVVFWNFRSEDTERNWLEEHLYAQKDLIGSRHNDEGIDSARDEMAFCYGDGFKWHRDVVQLQTRDAGEKLAVSFAVAKSANLSIYEWCLEQAVQRNSHIPEALAKTGELHLSRKEINVEIGRLYLLNNAINLETNMLDTPEEFWEDDRFEPEYEKTLKYFNVASRISILNKRLDVMRNLNQILMDSAHNVHASVLEWIIIWLIVAEVLVEMFSAWRETYYSD